jgi:hypothetical protein
MGPSRLPVLPIGELVRLAGPDSCLPRTPNLYQAFGPSRKCLRCAHLGASLDDGRRGVRPCVADGSAVLLPASSTLLARSVRRWIGRHRGIRPSASLQPSALEPGQAPEEHDQAGYAGYDQDIHQCYSAHPPTEGKPPLNVRPHARAHRTGPVSDRGGLSTPVRRSAGSLPFAASLWAREPTGCRPGDASLSGRAPPSAGRNGGLSTATPAGPRMVIAAGRAHRGWPRHACSPLADSSHRRRQAGLDHPGVDGSNPSRWAVMTVSSWDLAPSLACRFFT